MRWLLLALLAAGPLQAQTVMLCEMLGMAQQDTCCCHEPQPARDCEDAEAAPAPRHSGHDCCDEVVELQFAPDDRSGVALPSAPRAEPDPPEVLAQWLMPALPPAPAAALPAARALSSNSPDGSRLYLLTERLRI